MGDGSLDEQFDQMSEMMRGISGVVVRAVSGDVAELDDVIHQLDDQLERFGHGPQMDVRDDLWVAAWHDARATLSLERYRLLGVLADLSRALNDSWAVVGSSWAPDVVDVPPGLRARWEGTRGRALGHRYDLTQTPDQLDASIEHMERAVALEPDEPLYLAELAISYGMRYKGPLYEHHDVADLHAAIDAIERAIALVDTDDINCAPWTVSKASMLLDRFDATGDVGDVDAALATADDAIEWAASDQDRVLPLVTKARAARRRHELAGAASDVALGVAAVDRAMELAETAPSEHGLAAAGFASRWAIRRGDAGAAHAAGRRGLAMLATMRARQARIHDIEVWLRHGIDLATDTAWAHVLDGDPGAAAVVLEANRSTVLSELLPDLGDVAGGSPELLRELTTVLAALADQRDSDRELIRLRARRRELVDELQREAGVAPPEHMNVGDLQRMAGPTPVCYLASSIGGAFAVIVTAGGVEAIELDGGQRADRELDRFWRHVLWAPPAAHARSAAAREIAPADSLGPGEPSAADVLDDVVAWLGESVVGAVRDRVSGPVVVVPTGHWVGLPIDSVAGADGVWTQAPSVRALHGARRRASQAAAGRLLAVAEPLHTGTAQLPGAAAEVSAIGTMYSPAETLTGDRASSGAVLAALPHANVVHIACHGLGDIHDPMSSALLLAGDDRLEVRDLVGRVALAGVRLAVLSACQTAVTGLRLPDEAVSLATGMLYSGAAGTIASLWAVPDDATCALMVDFHERWRADDVHPASALRRAQEAMRTGELGEGRWTHPVNWAGFTYLGA